jgi:hypothetical protein
VIRLGWKRRTEKRNVTPLKVSMSFSLRSTPTPNSEWLSFTKQSLKVAMRFILFYFLFCSGNLDSGCQLSEGRDATGRSAKCRQF